MGPWPPGTARVPSRQVDWVTALAAGPLAVGLLAVGLLLALGLMAVGLLMALGRWEPTPRAPLHCMPLPAACAA